MRAYVIREDGTRGVLEIGHGDTDEGAPLAEIIGCDLFDMPRRTVGGRTYTMVVDDEGLLKERSTVAVWVRGLRAVETLVGDMLIMGAPRTDGWCTGLTDEDVENIEAHIKGGVLVYGE